MDILVRFIMWKVIEIDKEKRIKSRNHFRATYSQFKPFYTDRHTIALKQYFKHQES